MHLTIICLLTDLVIRFCSMKPANMLLSAEVDVTSIVLMTPVPHLLMTDFAMCGRKDHPGAPLSFE